MSHQDRPRKRKEEALVDQSDTAPPQKVRRREEEEEEEWWKKGVIYQVYPRSFMDSSGDGIGDIRGIESRLDHFVDLGVTILWLSPIYKSPMKDFGYDVSDFTQIDPLFGTMEDFRSLVTAMKQKGLKLVMDFIPNHSSHQHAWFTKSVQREDPYTDYYVWHPGILTGDRHVPPNNWLSVFGGPSWTWNEERKEFYYHQFLKEQPDLNFRNPLVLEEMKEVLKFWLDEGVAGFRVDAVSHLFEDEQLRDEPVATGDWCLSEPDNYNYLSHVHTYQQPENFQVVAAFREVLEDYKRKDGQPRLLMTEAYVSVTEAMKLYGSQSRPLAHFPFNFQLITELKRGCSAKDFYNAINDWLQNMPEGAWPNWVLGNHDVKRVANRLGSSLVDAMNMIALLLPGTPVTYQGEEIGMENAEISYDQTQDPAGKRWGPDKFSQFSRDPSRTPMQWNDKKNAGFSSAETTWLPIHPNYRQSNVASQRDDPASHYNVYKTLVQTRHSSRDVILHGQTQLATLEPVFAFSRIKSGSQRPGYIVAVNTGEEDVEVDLTSLGVAEVEDATVVTRSCHAKNQKTSPRKKISIKNIPLEPKAGIVFSFQPST